jgi:hypothetical protein
MKVAHFVPRTVDATLETEWHNLLGACLGVVDTTDRRPLNQTCDTRQGNRTLSIDPRRLSLANLIEYSSGDGRISVSGAHADLTNDIDVVLNLNHALLCKARKIALQETLRTLSRERPKGVWSSDWLVRRLAALAAKATLPEYFGVIEYYLAKRIAR